MSALEGALGLGGMTRVRPRGSLAVSGPRELVTGRAVLGAYAPNGDLAKETLRLTYEFGWPLGGGGTDEPLGDIVDVCHEDVLWGGTTVDHYGHFLVETGARLWPLLDMDGFEGMRVVFTTHNRRPYVRDWIDAFGLREFELPEQGAVRFTRMFVPETSWRLSAWICPEIRDVHLRARRGLDVKPVASGDIIWLSRTGMGSRRPLDELLFEWLLGDRVVVVRPETMRLADQIGMLESAAGIAGVIGSAFHSLLMVERAPRCLYMCPPWEKEGFSVQHRIVDVDASFRRTLVAMFDSPKVREAIARSVFNEFPGRYRICIPAALRAMHETVHPTLLDDRRLAAFADPGSAGGSRALRGALDHAVLNVLREPLSVEARRTLAMAFEGESLEDLASEQRQASTMLGDREAELRLDEPSVVTV